jgi:hypothetical protein
MGVSAILPTSTTSVPKIVSLPSCDLPSGSVDVNPLKQHTLPGYQRTPSTFAASEAPLFAFFRTSKEKPFSLEDPCLGFGYPFHELHLASLKNLFQFLTLLGFCSSELFSRLQVHSGFPEPIAHALHKKTKWPSRCAPAPSRCRAVSHAIWVFKPNQDQCSPELLRLPGYLIGVPAKELLPLYPPSRLFS